MDLLSLKNYCQIRLSSACPVNMFALCKACLLPKICNRGYVAYILLTLRDMRMRLFTDRSGDIPRSHFLKALTCTPFCHLTTLLTYLPVIIINE